MYWLICIVRATALESVRAKLADMGCLGLTVSHIADFQHGSSHVRIEVACTQGELKMAMESMREGALEKDSGATDGQIYVFALSDTIRIRTGESGKSAI